MQSTKKIIQVHKTNNFFIVELEDDNRSSIRTIICSSKTNDVVKNDEIVFSFQKIQNEEDYKENCRFLNLLSLIIQDADVSLDDEIYLIGIQNYIHTYYEDVMKKTIPYMSEVEKENDNADSDENDSDEYFLPKETFYTDDF